ncbi:MAG: methyltransferase domain-containing protein [Methylococcaceae bacterium]|nr:methyltransferase domain-containing protein [Methylococcaceae bacterium]
MSNASNRPLSLVKLAHQLVAEHVKPGDIVIDATVGNGHDTTFLLDLVLPDGHVFGFDIQQTAIDQANRRLAAQMSNSCLTLFRADHAAMRATIPLIYHGRIGMVMFNLGYLPGSVKHIKTQSKSTLAALAAAADLISLGGLITVVAYPGHDGGGDETRDVDQWRLGLDTGQYRTALFENHPDNPSAPKLFSVCKIG